MSDISDARFRDAEYFSDDLTSQDNECSTSKCGSPGFRRKDEPKDEEVCLTAFSYSETSWTDLKHSIYLDCVEASFVQNMFARCYCAEDLCGAACRPCFHDHGHDQAHGFSDRKNCCSTEASLRPQASFEVKWFCSKIRPCASSYPSCGRDPIYFLSLHDTFNCVTDSCSFSQRRKTRM
ncbi:hypothetical protein KP509_24G075200 [Ceratopteris richardii]|uniref:Uncharacterized protein n=1 Tax=Ceratopteris richardii TaxID=49495 RepID=A0A8T2RZ59_CERRI|nr:hypothetical protein KP509_24G075200 [Ceratopteris richardii]